MRYPTFEIDQMSPFLRIILPRRRRHRRHRVERSALRGDDEFGQGCRVLLR